MNEFDNFMKDDFVIVHKDKEFLKKLIKTSQNFLRNNLGLEIHPNKIYLQHYVKGVEFLGAFIKPNRVYAGSRIKGNFIAFIVSINNILEENSCILGKDEIMKSLKQYRDRISDQLFNTVKNYLDHSQYAA